MKQLITIICIMLTTFTYAQDSTAINTTQAERIIDKYSSKISESFEQGLDKITPVAEEGFEFVVRLQIAKGIVYLIPFIVLLISINYMNRMHKKYKAFDSNGSFFSEILVIIFTLISMATIYSAITRLIAPEWYAMQEIVKLFK